MPSESSASLLGIVVLASPPVEIHIPTIVACASIGLVGAAQGGVSSRAEWKPLVQKRVDLRQELPSVCRDSHQR
jgi:hypothetical protein